VLNRRHILLGASVSILASIPETAFSQNSESILGKSIVNGFSLGAFPYMNFMKNAGSMSAGTAAYPASLSSDGYPISNLSANIRGNYPFPASYFGRQRVQFSGRGSFQLAPGAIIYSGGGYVSNITPLDSGSVPYNLSIVGKTNPVVEFAFGFLVSAISDKRFRLCAIDHTRCKRHH